MQGPFALVAGNGLTTDLCRGHAAAQLGMWDTSRPLTWDVATPGEPGVPLLDRMDLLRPALEREGVHDPGSSHFHIIDAIAAAAGDVTAPVVIELRHYLALAYSTFQLAVDRVSLVGWSWRSFLSSNRKAYRGGVSFNYDLVVERLLRSAGIVTRRFMTPERIGEILLKPHGSIDFEYEGIIAGPPPGYPMRNWVAANDAPLSILPAERLLEARVEPELVAPMQASHARGYQWVKPGFEWFRDAAQPLRSCIFAGLSYWPADRAEIDVLLDCLPAGCTVVVANPAPPDDFMAAVDERGLEVEMWRDGPPAT